MLVKCERVYIYLQASAVASCAGCTKMLPPAGAVGPCFSAYSPHSAAPGPVRVKTACWSLNHRNFKFMGPPRYPWCVSL